MQLANLRLTPPGWRGNHFAAADIEERIMKKLLAVFFAVALAVCLSPLSAMAADWAYLGEAHVDGQHDHDTINVGKAAGRYRYLQIRVKDAPIQFDRIVVHYGNGQAETLQVRDVIRAGGHSRAIALQGDRIVQSFELWYAKAKPGSSKPALTLWGQR
jgi:hypothetical protein